MLLVQVQHALKDTAKIMSTLSNPKVTTAEELPGGWTVNSVLERVAQGSGNNHRFDALIDAGGIITGLSNADVARTLLSVKSGDQKHFALKDKDAIVFLDAATDRPSFLTRDMASPRPLSECTFPLHRRFVFFDQVHCTGVDITQTTDAHAALLLGKDNIFRDLAQAAWRMRRLGLNGQTVVILLVPEVALLATTSIPSSGAGSWRSSLLNTILTKMVTYGAEKIALNECKLRIQEQATPKRRFAIKALIAGSDPHLAKDAFSEIVDYSVTLAPIEGSLETEVVQQQHNEQQKEQQRLEQKMKNEYNFAIPKQWRLSALQEAASNVSDFVPIRAIKVRPPDSKQSVGFDLAPPDLLASDNFIRTGAVALSGMVLEKLRNVFVVLQYTKASPSHPVARGLTAGAAVHVAVSLIEAEAIRRYLLFSPSKTCPESVTAVLWTRRGSPLLPVPAAPPGLSELAMESLVLYRFFNSDLWYNEDEIATLERELLRAAAPAQRAEMMIRLEAFLRFSSLVRRRDNMNFNTSPLSGRIIPAHAKGIGFASSSAV
jgi:hypothetical protein